MSKAKIKKVLAGMLATTMVLGMSATAFAAETTPAGSGTISGSGTSEGHVDKEVQNVVLPTVPAGSTPFAYTMDPERLIQETGGQKYEDYTFPEQASDTGVYFLTAEKTYSNTSNTLQVINKSSCDVTLTVKVKATQNSAKDITLVSAPSTSTTAAELYLGLKVGSSTQDVSSTEASVSKTIAGTASNFETVYDSATSKYVYQEKESATSWKAMNISMTGSVNQYAIAADTTAPTVDITWEWNKAADGATADSDAVEYTTAQSPSISGATEDATGTGWGYTANFTKGTDLVFTVDFGTEATEISSAAMGAALDNLDGNAPALSISGDTVTIAGSAWAAAPAGSERYCKIVLDDATEFVIKITLFAE